MDLFHPPRNENTMPSFDDPDMLSHDLQGSAYGFSAARIEDLGAAEYTLVTIVADCSGSIQAFCPDIERCIREVVRSCRSQARADNLMLRLMTFDSTVVEVHGFRPVSACDLDAYRGCITPRGSTALFDASHNAIASAIAYGTELGRHDFEVNAIAFIITDGQDNASRTRASDIAALLSRSTANEELESLTTILVGVGARDDDALGTYLEAFRRQAGLDAAIALARADAKTLGRLARFVSQSISTQSQALGSGHAARLLGF